MLRKERPFWMKWSAMMKVDLPFLKMAEIGAVNHPSAMDLMMKGYKIHSSVFLGKCIFTRGLVLLYGVLIYLIVFIIILIFFSLLNFNCKYIITNLIWLY